MNTEMAAAHRAALVSAMQASGGGVAILRSGVERIRNRDVHYRFRVDSDFWYLTAFDEPDAVAVLRPDADEERFVLFVRPRDRDLETWNGRRAGVEGAREIFGADAAYPIAELDEQLPRLLRGARRVLATSGEAPGFDAKLLGWLRDLHLRNRDGVVMPTELVSLPSVLSELRLIKGPAELESLRRAAAITDAGHRAAMAALRPGMGEWEIEALVDGTFRASGGWGTGYPSICAGGENATILHYNTNRMRVRADDALLLDAGCEVDGYTADVTRCFPSGSAFTPEQRDLYAVVLEAQKAAVAHIRPGVTFLSVHELALRRLVEGMIGLGLLPGPSADAAIESGAYKRCYMHRTSHWLGLDVHDVGRYHERDGSSITLRPGMVLTVEPGLYVAPDDELAPARLRGIGMRIEDDVLVTADGHENLTAAIPKEIADVEAVANGGGATARSGERQPSPSGARR